MACRVWGSRTPIEPRKSVWIISVKGILRVLVRTPPPPRPPSRSSASSPWPANVMNDPHLRSYATRRRETLKLYSFLRVAEARTAGGVGGRVQGAPQDLLLLLFGQAAQEPHQLHIGAIGRAGTALRRDALPGRLHARGAQREAGTERGQSAGGRDAFGEVNMHTCSGRRSTTSLLRRYWKSLFDHSPAFLPSSPRRRSGSFWPRPPLRASSIKSISVPSSPSSPSWERQREKT